MTSAASRIRVGAAASKLLDRIDEFGPGTEVEVALTLASIRLSDGSRRLEWMYSPGDDATAADILRPALATLEYGIGERRRYPPVTASLGDLEDDDGS
jgi:hypothetical protein